VLVRVVEDHQELTRSNLNQIQPQFETRQSANGHSNAKLHSWESDT
jgi:hypothetical protein